MSTRIKLVQNDTQPPLVVSLTDHESGSPIDVSGAAVVLKFREVGLTTLQATLSGTLLAGYIDEDGAINTDDETLGAGGRVSFAWVSPALEGPAGQYEGEIQITYAGGTIQTIYEVLKFTVREDF